MAAEELVVSGATVGLEGINRSSGSAAKVQGDSRYSRPAGEEMKPALAASSFGVETVINPRASSLQIRPRAMDALNCSALSCEDGEVYSEMSASSSAPAANIVWIDDLSSASK